MNCENVVSNFQNILLEQIEAIELSKDLSLHLQNCFYCKKDCQKLVFDYTNQPNSKKEISQTAFLLFKPIQTNITYQLTLLNYDSFPKKLLKELDIAAINFLHNPLGFSKEIMEVVFEQQNRPYWDKSVRIASLIWLSSCISIVLYGGLGWWWFSSNNVEFKPKPSSLFDNTQVYYINASLPYPPTYWSRDVSKIDSNKTSLADNKSLSSKASSKSKGRISQPSNFNANLATKNNSNIGTDKKAVIETNGYFLATNEPKATSTNSNNIGIAKETTGNFVTGGRFISSTTAQISTVDIEQSDEECCGYDNIPVCAAHKAMQEKELKEKASKAFEFGNQPKVSLSLASPNTNSVSIVATPNTVSGGGMFSTNTKSNANNSTTEKARSVEVELEVRPLLPIIKVGRLGILSIIVKPRSYEENPLLASFTTTIQFNSSVVKINRVSEDGLMSFYGVNPDFNYNISKNSVKINISRPVNAKAVRAFGQLVLIYFEAIAPGFADFTLTDVQLLGIKGETLPITLANSQTEVVGN